MTNKNNQTNEKAASFFYLQLSTNNPFNQFNLIQAQQQLEMTTNSYSPSLKNYLFSSVTLNFVERNSHLPLASLRLSLLHPSFHSNRTQGNSYIQSLCKTSSQELKWVILSRYSDSVRNIWRLLQTGSHEFSLWCFHPSIPLPH